MNPSRKTFASLFAMSGNRCAFAGCPHPIVDAETCYGEVCHIKAKSPGGPRFDAQQSNEERESFSNLVLLCRNHHKKVDSSPDKYTVEALLEMKSVHEKTLGRDVQLQDSKIAMRLMAELGRVTVSGNTGQVAIHSPGAIQAHTVNIRSGKRLPEIAPPPGSIGADVDRCGYVAYLIERYNKFAKATPRATKFNFGAISGRIATKFGGRWRLLHVGQFESLCLYLHDRIARTIPAKLSASRGQRCYSTFLEFIAKR